MPSVRRGRFLLPASLALLAACQPSERRALLLDMRLAEAPSLAPAADPWVAAGYDLAYRRFFPHLTRADLGHYRVVILLAGDRPEKASDGLATADLGMLTEWLMGGGVVVLGTPPPGIGSHDRWAMNRWLEWNAAGIVIADSTPSGHPLDAVPVQRVGMRGLATVQFAVGRATALAVQDPNAALAEAGGTVVAAAVRAGEGLIAVLPRETLTAPGAESNLLVPAAELRATASAARAFLVTLARWTRRPAEWARIPPAGPRPPLRLADPPDSLGATSPALAPPLGVQTERPAAQAGRAVPVGTPGWIGRQGIHALYARAASDLGVHDTLTLDSLANLADVGAFNVLLTVPDVAVLVDSARATRRERDAVRAAWRATTERLATTTVRWIPLAAAGDTAGACPFDPARWSDRLVPVVRVLARLAATRSDVIPAVGLDLSVPDSLEDSPFCDSAWAAVLRAWSRDTALSAGRVGALQGVPAGGRYVVLRDAGLLDRYGATLEGLVTERAAALRAEVRRIRPGLLLALFAPDGPRWLTRGTARGLEQGGGPPLLLFTAGPEAPASVNAVQAPRLVPASIPTDAWGRTGRMLFREFGGFWTSGDDPVLLAPGDSLHRLLRRLGRER